MARRVFKMRMCPSPARREKKGELFGPGNVRSKAQTEGGPGVGQRSLADDVAGSIQHADVMLTVSEVQAEGEPADNSGSGG